MDCRACEPRLNWTRQFALNDHTQRRKQALPVIFITLDDAGLWTMRVTTPAFWLK